jgi:Amino acid transporters
MTDTVETLTVADVERQKLQRHFGRFDILFFLICTDRRRGHHRHGRAGGRRGLHLDDDLRGRLLHPAGAAVLRARHRLPAGGRPYYWTRLAFGHLAGAVNNFLYWITNPVWIGGTLAISCIGAVEVFFNNGNTVPTRCSTSSRWPSSGCRSWPRSPRSAWASGCPRPGPSPGSSCLPCS